MAILRSISLATSKIEHGVLVPGGEVGGEEHGFSLGVFSSLSEPLDQDGSLGGDGLAVDLDRSGGVDLDEDVVFFELVDRLGLGLDGGVGGLVVVGLGDLEGLEQDHLRGHEEEQHELEGDVDHRGQVEFLDGLGPCFARG